MLAKAWLWISALAFIGLGVALMVSPAGILAKVDLHFDTPTAFADIRADYGGCIIGLGLFLGWCAIRPERVRLGLVCAGLTLAGYATGRLFSLLVDGMPKRIIFILLVTEVLWAALCLVLARTAQDSPVDSLQKP